MSTAELQVVKPYQPLTLADLRRTAAADDPWLWDGFLAPGNTTLLTSQWKCGKTTLLSVLLARLGTGGLLCGRAVRPGRAVVISEEGPDLWEARGRTLDLGAHVGLLCRPFCGRPRPAQWEALIDSMVEFRQAGALDLLVIDPLASFLPSRCENDAGGILEALLPLQQLTKLGVAAFVQHHPRKGPTAEGQASRGSGALTGAVDILIEMGWHGRPFSDDRRRRLRAFSRHACTPRRILIELNAEGTDYLVHGDTEEDDFTAEGWDVLFGVLDEAFEKMSRQGILNNWPLDYPKPAPATLRRWLERAVKEGKVLQSGSGRRSSPFKYWLPSQAERWAKMDPWELPPLPEVGPLFDR